MIWTVDCVIARLYRELRPSTIVRGHLQSFQHLSLLWSDNSLSPPPPSPSPVGLSLPPQEFTDFLAKPAVAAAPKADFGEGTY